MNTMNNKKKKLQDAENQSNIITEKINNKEKTTIWVPKIESRCFGLQRD